MTNVIIIKWKLYFRTCLKHLFWGYETDNFRGMASSFDIFCSYTCIFTHRLKRTTDIIKLCDFSKAGEIGDTFMIETDQHRLLYFTTETKVKLNCPENNINTKLVQCPAKVGQDCGKVGQDWSSSN